ncbi:MAG: PT domain-containing protein [Phycisphaerales bacterium]
MAEPPIHLPNDRPNDQPNDRPNDRPNDQPNDQPNDRPTPARIAAAVAAFGFDPGPSWDEMQDGRDAQAAKVRRDRRQRFLIAGACIVGVLFMVYPGWSRPFAGRNAGGGVGPPVSLLPASSGGRAFAPDRTHPPTGMRRIEPSSDVAEPQRATSADRERATVHRARWGGAALVIVALGSTGWTIMRHRRRERAFAMAEGWADPRTGEPLAVPTTRDEAEAAVRARLFAALYMAPWPRWSSVRRVLEPSGAFVRGRGRMLLRLDLGTALRMGGMIVGAQLLMTSRWRHDAPIDAILDLGQWPIFVLAIWLVPLSRIRGMDQRCVRCAHEVPPEPAVVPARCPECARSWRWPGSIVVGQSKLRPAIFTIIMLAIVFGPIFVRLAIFRPRLGQGAYLPSWYRSAVVRVTPERRMVTYGSAYAPAAFTAQELERLVPVIQDALSSRRPKLPNQRLLAAWRGDEWLAKAAAGGRLAPATVDSLAEALLDAEIVGLQRGEDGAVAVEVRLSGWLPSGPGAADAGVVVGAVSVDVGDGLTSALAAPDPAAGAASAEAPAAWVAPSVADRWTRPRRVDRMAVHWVDDRLPVAAGRVVPSRWPGDSGDGPLRVATSVFIEIPALPRETLARIVAGTPVTVQLRFIRTVNFSTGAPQGLAATWTVDGTPTVMGEHLSSFERAAICPWPAE